MPNSSRSPTWMRRIGRDDVRVVEPGRRADLAQEAFRRFRVVEALPVDHLEDFEAVHQFVLRQVDDAHAAAAQLADDLVLRVVAQLRQDRRSWRRSPWVLGRCCRRSANGRAACSAPGLRCYRGRHGGGRGNCRRTGGRQSECTPHTPPHARRPPSPPRRQACLSRGPAERRPADVRRDGFPSEAPFGPGRRRHSGRYLKQSGLSADISRKRPLMPSIPQPLRAIA